MAESTKTRSSVLLIGRDCDLNFLIELSLLTATIKISPNFLASFNKWTCPAWIISKQPFVKTTFLFAC